VSSLATGIALFLGFHALGIGFALWLRTWLALPARFLPVLLSLSTAALSYAIFWIAFLVPRLRSIAVAGAVGTSLALAVVACRDPRTRAALRAPAAWLPPAATALLALLWLWPILAAGPTINQRLTWTLPPDNILPGLFAYQVVTSPGGLRPAALLGPGSDRASERPPLQAAVTVTVGSMVRGSDDEYTILATICQLQWLPAVLLLGSVLGLPRRTLAFVVAACLVSGFFFVNTVYAWPKLYAAALMLTALAIVLEPSPQAPGTARARVAIAAAAFTLALLAHPGPAYSLLALPICWPLLRSLVQVPRSWRTALTGGAIVLALVAPWLAYQTFVDPPTGRLLRQHLADGRAGGTPVEAIVRANIERPFAEQVSVRFGNLVAQAGNPLVDVWPVAIADGQRQQFFHHGAALGVLLIGLVMVLRPPRPGTADDAVRRLAVAALVALAIWSLLVYGAGAAVIHHGSPVTTAVLFLAGAYGLTRLPATAAWALLAVHALAAGRLWFLPIWWGPWAGVCSLWPQYPHSVMRGRCGG
jgi:hypothetical protein